MCLYGMLYGIRMHVSTAICMHVHAYLCMCVCVCVSWCVCDLIVDLDANLLVKHLISVPPFLLTHIQAGSHTCIHVCVYTHTHTHTHQQASVITVVRDVIVCVLYTSRVLAEVSV